MHFLDLIDSTNKFRYISDLEQKLASLEHSKDAGFEINIQSSSQTQDEIDARTWGGSRLKHSLIIAGTTQADPNDLGRNSSPPETHSGRTSPEPPLTNDLASGIPQYISDATGKPGR